MKGVEENTLASTLREQISLDRDLESTKEALALKSDFNLLDAFRIFDRYDNGSVNLYDIEDTLRLLGVFGTREEQRLFLKKFDKNGDGRLRYSEFCDAFTPKDYVYSSMVTARISHNASNSYPRSSVSLKLLNH
jgi:Ca2+-binding EF-hand superfamily protein